MAPQPGPRRNRPPHRQRPLRRAELCYTGQSPFCAAPPEHREAVSSPSSTTQPTAKAQQKSSTSSPKSYANPRQGRLNINILCYKQQTSIAPTVPLSFPAKASTAPSRTTQPGPPPPSTHTRTSTTSQTHAAPSASAPGSLPAHQTPLRLLHRAPRLVLHQRRHLRLRLAQYHARAP